MRTILGHIVSHPVVAGVCILFTFLGGDPLDGVMSDGYGSVLVNKISAPLLHIWVIVAYVVVNLTTVRSRPRRLLLLHIK